MSRQRHAGPAVLLLIVLAVVFSLTADSGIRAAAANRGSGAAPAGAAGGTVVKTTPPAAKATPVKTTTVAAAQKNNQGQGQMKPKTRGTTKAQREAARSRQAPQKKGVKVKFAGMNPATAMYSPLATVGTAAITTLATMAAPNSMPDYFAVANWANSPLPTVGPGPIKGITVLTGGGGYQNPVVAITDQGGIGTGATATANVTAGVITSITVTNGGDGYSAPTVSITDPNGISAGATAFVSAFGSISGGMRKFVDTLPGLTSDNANNLGTYIPLAVPDTATFPGSDFYQIGLKEYQHPFHSDLPNPSNLAYPAAGTNVRGYFDIGNSVDSAPHYLGPLILATRNRPVRVLFKNQIATDLNIPNDITYMGAGAVTDGINNALASQKRATLHLHGGATPWISDGTPHQWITPAGGDGEPAAFGFMKGMSFMNVPDMVTDSGIPCASVVPAVPCFTPTLDDGTATFYWTNQQSGKLLFYHDHAYGVTRLNVYAGEAAGYLIVDPTEETALAAATVPGTVVTDPTTGGIVSADLAHLVPLVVQDKTFVPDTANQLPATDPTWDITNYGGFGSLWFTHVYMPNQNPYDNSGANPFGRWDWGPWFWPAQDPSTFVPDGQPKVCTSAAYPGQTLICPGTPLPSGTPEGFMDTPVINGTAYPAMNVTTAAYRFRMLMAGNDRTWNLGLYYAVDKNGVVCKGSNGFDAASCTEMGMVPATPHTAITNPPLCTTNPTFPPAGGLATIPNNVAPLNGTGLQANCWPTTWPTDGRDGGVPDPATAGPPFIQIGTEGGLLPATVVIPSTPNGFEYNRRSITVLNVFAHGLLLGPAERADVIVDFSSVPPGSVLILYNDAPAPVPAFDTRFDYYTGDPDQTATGGAPSTQPGYGPNTRTIMQIKVVAPGGSLPGNAVPFSLTSLAAAQPALFVSTQDPIIVPETAYPVGNGNAPTDTYVRISDTAINLGTGELSGLTLVSPGAGYTSAPIITIYPPPNGGVQATAVATLAATGVSTLTLTNGGSGYTSVPDVVLSGGGGSGAAALAALTPTGVGSVTVNSGGTYTAAPAVSLTGGGGTGATADATLAPTTLASVSLTAGGSGYTLAPLVSISGGGGTGATVTATLTPTAVASVSLTNGGSNYTSAPNVAIVGDGTNATATAGLTPTTVASVALIAGGSYTFAPPLVTLSGGGGAGATATAALTPTSLASLTLTTGGSGYISVPAIAITGGGGTGATATATLSVNAVAVTAGGSGYSTPPTVVFTNGGGSGATASAVMTPTSIQNVVLISGGSGYRSAPTVTFVGGGGTGATATANVNRSGVVTGVKVTNGGSGYTSLPTITFTGGGGSGASATATLKPTSVASVVVINGGSLYTSAPAVSFTGGGTGVGAAATASMMVSALTLTSGGSGFTDASTVVVSFTNGGGSGAAATANLTPTPVAGVTVISAGSGYTSAPSVVFSSGTAAAFAALTPTSVGTLSLTTGGSGYTVPPAVNFSGGGGGGATAFATLAATSVASVALTNAGSGFTSAPTVSLNGTGTGAAATATLTPTPVASVTVTNAGSGYTAPPAVVFAPGGATATAALQGTSVASVSLTAGGGGYTSAPTVSFTGGGGGTGATAVAGVPPTSVASVTLTNPGSGYNTAPTVMLTGGGGTGASVVAGAPVGTSPLLPKTIQELFTLDYGRMNATLGVEVPFTNFLTQTTIPYGYVDPPTEIFKEGETQFWKVTHNGVDTHFLHFHLFNVQVINRVGWDGAIKPPDANELSWKDTVRMNPLEDIIVALRPFKQTLPWDLPNSVRPLDVTKPVGSANVNQFTNLDPTNLPVTVTNDLTNFGWEYVWHCHILGHEENDMMRAMVFAVAPVAPSNLVAALDTSGNVALSWMDNSLNETGFAVQVSTSAAGPWTTLAVVPGVAGTGNTVTYTDATSPAGTYYYQVIAANEVGYTKSFPAPAVGYAHPTANSLPAGILTPIAKP